MAITLTASERDTLRSMREQATPGNYWPIYQWLADTIQAKGVGSTDSAVLWLRGATEVNAGRGAFSELVRTYTAKQYQLRYGSALTIPQMQSVSDEIAKSLLRDVLGENEPEWPIGQVPDITRIAIADATEVGRQLFNTPGDTSAPPTNSAWSGALLFGLLGSDQSFRLTSTGTASTLDTS